MTTNAHDRLLVLDDDPDVGATIAAICISLGFEALSTTSAEEFFSLLDSWKPSHLAIDLIMPDTDGIQVLVRLAESGCDAGIIITSGAGSRVLDAAQRAASEHGLAVLGVASKPFTSRKLREILSREKPRISAPAMQPGAAVVLAETETGTTIITEADLDEAIERQQLFIHLQPKIDCGTFALTGAEALVRWRHPERGIIPPDSFIPLAERTGQIDRITTQVIGLSLDWLAREYPDTGIQIAINLSAGSLVDLGLADELAGACASRGIAPQRIVLEITETSAMSDPIRTLDLATRLRIKGFQLSIDDFGVGYSSLVQLARLPFSEMKIDTSFVRNAAISEESRIIIRTIISLGHGLGLRITAEGVEDRFTLDLLRNARCDQAQGFFIGRPMDPDALRSWSMPSG